MTKKTKPQVKPVSRYSVPKYPSHEDPDPTLYPKPVPYPFSRELITAVTGLGMASCVGEASATFKPPPEKPKTVAPVEEATGPVKTSVPAPDENPFTLERSGLPHRTSAFGTGQPSRVGEKVARRLIDRVFAEEGVELKPAHAYSTDDVAFEADGYDPKQRLGYVLAR